MSVLTNAYEAFNKNYIESALHYYKLAIKKDPGNKTALFGLASSYQMLRQNDDAIRVYLKLLELYPKDYNSFNNMIILVAGQSPESALMEFKRLDHITPHNPAILAQIGTLSGKLGNLEEAVKHLKKAVFLEPNNIIYLYNLAITLDKAGYGRDATVYYNNVMSKMGKEKGIEIDYDSVYKRYKFLKRHSQ